MCEQKKTNAQNENNKIRIKKIWRRIEVTGRDKTSNEEIKHKTQQKSKTEKEREHTKNEEQNEIEMEYKKKSVRATVKNEITGDWRTKDKRNKDEKM